MGKKNKKHVEEVTMSEYLQAKVELEKAQKAAGIQPKEKGLSKFISWLFEKQDERKRHSVKKIPYILIAIFGGWCGAHRFFEKRWVLGIVYSLPAILSVINPNLFNLVGIPMAMTVIDILIAVGKYSDENGEIII